MEIMKFPILLVKMVLAPRNAHSQMAGRLCSWQGPQKVLGLPGCSVGWHRVDIGPEGWTVRAPGETAKRLHPGP